jgi:FkbM family methyltransferase
VDGSNPPLTATIIILNKMFQKFVHVDVGANNGDTSVHIAKDHPNGLVYAFEPTPHMIEITKSKSHHLRNYFLVEKAVSDYNGKAIFNVAGQADWGCSSLLSFSDKSQTDWPGRTDFVVTEEIEVDVIRLDSFIEENNIQQIDYIKIDTQGSDLKVLQGLGKYISIVKAGSMEAAGKEDILYYGQNTQGDSIKFLEDNGFKITGIIANDELVNEVMILFERNN